jgi:ribA/ribD-fused uncharacterized protein
MLAMTEDKITRFDGEYRFLSNFYPSPIVILGFDYPTVEHAYQSWKAKNLADWKYVALSETPAVAKRRGREIDCREDWDRIKLEVMEYCLQKKFEDPAMLEMLVSTFPMDLVEGNWWGDTFWGVCNGKGENHLGKLLMRIRLEGVLGQ